MTPQDRKRIYQLFRHQADNYEVINIPVSHGCWSLDKVSSVNLPGGGRPARKADNLTAICEPIVYKMWEPRRPTNLWASTACYRESFTFLPFITYIQDEHKRSLNFRKSIAKQPGKTIHPNFQTSYYNCEKFWIKEFKCSCNELMPGELQSGKWRNLYQKRIFSCNLINLNILSKLIDAVGRNFEWISF
jgi:hypothetical protein